MLEGESRCIPKPMPDPPQNSAAQNGKKRIFEPVRTRRFAPVLLAPLSRSVTASAIAKNENSKREEPCELMQ